MVIVMTKRWVDSVKPPASGQAQYFDTKVRGLTLRVGYGGRKSWSVLYRLRGSSKKRRAAINPHLELEDARARAREIVSAAWDGKDAATETREALRSPTIDQLVDEFAKRYLPNLRTGSEYERNLRAEILGEIRARKERNAPAPVRRAISWKGRKAGDIRRRDVIALLDGIVDRGAPLTANRVLAQLRKLFNWAIARDLVESNPCTAVSRPGKETRRDRVLTDAEIRVLWRALDGVSMDVQTRVAIRLVLVTAQRPGEVCGMQWSELDRATGWWTIPGAKAKNGLTHRVPLSPLALDLIAELPELDPVWVFPSPRMGKDGKSRPMKRGALSHGVGKARALAPDVPRYTVHDLRRTAASCMTANGISRVAVGKVLNHVEPGVTAIYDRNSYDPEKRRALATWEHALRRILAEPKAGEVAA